MLEAGDLPDLAALRARFEPAHASPVPAVTVDLPSLAAYDALLGARTPARDALIQGAWG